MRASRSSGGLGLKSRGRVAIGATVLVVSTIYGLQALTGLPIGQMAQPGPAAFPVAVAVFTGLASLAVILEELATANRQEGAVALPVGRDLYRLLGVTLCALAYVALLEHLGFALASGLMSLALVRLLWTGSWTHAVLAALGIAVSTYVLFVRILEVPLPKGILLGIG